jgi:uncharacterized protein (TIGR00251 family)
MHVNTCFSHYHWHENCLIINLHLQTRAHQNAFIGLYNNRLKLQLKTPPIDGKANKHLIRFLANYFGVSQNQVKIKIGIGSKYKIVLIFDPQINLDAFKKCKENI